MAFAPIFQRPFSATFDRRAAAAAVLVKQDYLLDMDAYATVSASTGTRGREFTVTAAAACYGGRVKPRNTEAHTLRLYRVSDQALLASKAFTPDVALVAMEVLFDAPVALSSAATYRIAIDGGSRAYVRRAGVDEPDGAITTLTGNVYCYASGDDVYPNLTANTVSLALEPTIYA